MQRWTTHILTTLSALCAAGAVTCAALAVQSQLQTNTAAEAAAQRVADDAAARSDAERLAAEQGVTIIWTSDESQNCGVARAASRIGGCFHPKTPDRIYVSPDAHAEATTMIVLHELAHVEQFRERLPLDECDADRRAALAGADISLSIHNCGV